LGFRNTREGGLSAFPLPKSVCFTALRILAMRQNKSNTSDNTAYLENPP
jgi:hypothetical protein